MGILAHWCRSWAIKNNSLDRLEEFECWCYRWDPENIMEVATFVINKFLFKKWENCLQYKYEENCIFQP